MYSNLAGNILLSWNYTISCLIYSDAKRIAESVHHVLFSLISNLLYSSWYAQWLYLEWDIPFVYSAYWTNKFHVKHRADSCFFGVVIPHVCLRYTNYLTFTSDIYTPSLSQVRSQFFWFYLIPVVLIYLIYLHSITLLLDKKHLNYYNVGSPNPSGCAHSWSH